jgi:hypothetical protein
MLGGLMNPQMLGQLMAGPLKGPAEQFLGMGGFPLLAGGSNALLRGGQDIGNIMKGSIGNVKAGA